MATKLKTAERLEFEGKLSEDLPLGHLSILFQTAMQSEGREFAAAFVVQRKDQRGFLIKVKLPAWAESHVIGMEAESQRQMLESIEKRTGFVQG